MKILGESLLVFWQSLAEMSSYLLLGFFLAGIIAIFITPTLVQRHLGKPGLLGIIKATLFGIPLPLCSCSVLPIAASFRKNGASRGSSLAFLISTPQTGIDSILVTFSLLGPMFAIVRPLVALLSGIIGGVFVDFAYRKEPETAPENSFNSENNNHQTKQGLINTVITKFLYALHYGFFVLAKDISKPLLFGLFFSSALAIFIPDNFLAQIFGQNGGILGMLVMIAVSIPMYVCATASVPIAAILIAKGISPGAALVFLMTGPATNIAAIAIIWKVMGKKAAICYLITIIVCALVAGLCLDYIIVPRLGESSHCCPWKLPGLLQNISGVVLLCILIYGIFPQKNKKQNINNHKLEEKSENTQAPVCCCHCKKHDD